MSKLKSIPLNQFQLARLLDDEQMTMFKLMIDRNVYCTHCGDMCEEGVTVSETVLNSLNDIQVSGTCNTCEGSVSRIVEFGEDKAFYDKATEFRK
tara:strand:- start:71 stop:355 length:285 start_codon:yes stop_codon:yes gene_type:complete